MFQAYIEPSPRRALSIIGLPILLFSLFAAPGLEAESDLSLEYGPRFHIVERENLRVYENEAYRGFLFRERRGYFRRESDDSSSGTYVGEVYLVGEMKREAKLQEKPVDAVREVAFRLREDGSIQVTEGSYPLRSGFPVVPDEAVSPGDQWRSEGEEHYQLSGGGTVRIPFTCRYTYRGEERYLRRPVRRIDFEYGFSASDAVRREDLRSVRGRSSGTLLIFTDERGGYFIRERIERGIEHQETEVREAGFRLTWSTGISPARIDSLEQRIVSALEGTEESRSTAGGGGAGGQGDAGGQGGQGGRGGGNERAAGGDEQTGGVDQQAGGSEERTAGGSEEGSIGVERREEGLVLNLPDIHFVPDQAKVLPDERGRLDKLAELLKLAPEATFLVKGHTADVGSKESQYELSVKRAKAIIDEMNRRGIAKDNFLYRGVGGDEPVASNETEEGRARNRRVEVIILDG